MKQVIKSTSQGLAPQAVDLKHLMWVLPAFSAELNASYYTKSWWGETYSKVTKAIGTGTDEVVSRKWQMLLILIWKCKGIEEKEAGRFTLPDINYYYKATAEIFNLIHLIAHINY